MYLSVWTPFSAVGLCGFVWGFDVFTVVSVTGIAGILNYTCRPLLEDLRLQNYPSDFNKKTSDKMLSALTVVIKTVITAKILR